MRDTVAEALGDRDVAVGSVTRLSGGASRTTWSLVAHGSDGSRRPLVLQLGPDPATLPEDLEPDDQRITMVTEGRLVAAAGRHGVPTAPVLGSGDVDGPFGRPHLLTGHVAGETIAPRILRDDRYADARARLTGQLGAAAGALHGVPVDEVPGVAEVDPVRRYREVLDELGWPSPTFELAFRFLEREGRPDRVDPVLVHGDLRLGNVIVDDTGLAAVIDWELARLGQPGEDLGWMCVRAWRFGAPGPVAGLGERAELLAAYGKATGRTPTLDELRWFEVLGTLMWGVMCMTQASRHLSGTITSMEHAAIGRRVAENEHDLLDLITQGSSR